MKRTLLISAGYEPVKVITWKKAIILMVLEKVEVIEHYNDIVRSPSIAFQVPSVVKLHRFIHHVPFRVKFSRHNLYQRDNFTCQYCRNILPFSQLTYDHIIPRSRGGKTSWTNVVTACVRCNRRKGNKDLQQFNFKLIKEPVEPAWLPPRYPMATGMEEATVWFEYLGINGGSPFPPVQQ